MHARSWVVLSLSLAASMPPNLACSTSAVLGTDNSRGGGPTEVAAIRDGGSVTQGPMSGGGPQEDAATSVGVGDGATSQGPGAKHVVTQLDAAAANLGPLPQLTNVTATEREDSVGIDFDPTDNAVDYRVYALPNPSDVMTNADGSLTIKNAIYRCAGLRQSFDLPNNTSNSLNRPSAGQTYVNGTSSWGATVPSKPTLGYVFLTPASDRLAVYAIAIHATAPENGWRETRPKVYTTDSTQRQTLLAQGGRDDGIVFYVPSAASAATQTIYGSEAAQVVAGQGWMQYTDSYFGAADKASHAKDATPPAPAFQVLAAPASGAVPLMSVLYQAPQGHVELVAGNERFKRASNQGQGPLWHLEWSGLQQPTTLVVEALASGCPYRGLLSPESLAGPPQKTIF
jgi:hypothetical protein